MKTHKHIIIGIGIAIVASTLPDAVLASYRWKKDLKPTHPLAKLHRFCHSLDGALALFWTCWIVHIFADWYTHPPHLYEANPDLGEWYEKEQAWAAAHVERS